MDKEHFTRKQYSVHHPSLDCVLLSYRTIKTSLSRLMRPRQFKIKRTTKVTKRKTIHDVVAIITPRVPPSNS